MGANTSRESDTGPIQLDGKEIKLLKASWDTIKSKDDLGLAIMIRIFHEHKEIKNKWIFAANLETEAEMISNSQVRYHGSKIAAVFVQIIDQMNENSVFGQTELDKAYDLFKLGKSHFSYTVEREHFVHFGESLVYALKKQIKSGMWNSKLERVWLKFFRLVSNRISEGIETQAKQASPSK